MHLRNADFLDVQQFPTIMYKMKKYKKQGDTYKVVGHLTLRGVTKEVTLIGTFNGVTKDPGGSTRAGFTADGTLNRKNFGMIWNKALDTPGVGRRSESDPSGHQISKRKSRAEWAVKI